MILLSDKKFTTGEVYHVYKKLCNKIGIDPLTQRRISDLISELDMLGIINSIVISKGRYGRTREITIDADIEIMKKVLREDYRLETLKRYEEELKSLTSLETFEN